ncbi:DUF2461 domain-containing protein [Pectobacterium parmentieri]|uniref:DUF2461 domain-containing protein n=2 Tax=Pectobacterium parmentieri TaxID=1905730 RepID=A0A0H3IAF3_PECPM|nr:DUF2461 domain-containing protein [Pectobacterium parmentieri]ACX89940.1 conserved hypothetical protein [Pectobacterium parmentieri WPP163]AFI92431.1 Hypothetical protein W5S_4379 [Pectobacterium parmentieri]AOR61220.1 hypothetical protein A8F97_20400 [Pectobacterium parmentieri]AYH03320.1 DUF2461 domain-containing protein [Pectobacterium parmentieri]AYH07648.1 DUF2461 domain-containing protein [Pectobacterium parmentieri]
MATQFTGFSQAGLTFLQQVRQNNDKAWFDEHRSIYDEQLVAPFRTLVDELSLTMLQIDDHFETRPAIGKTLSRIHRDTRFSHDKSRYRSHMWLTFKRTRKDWTDAPVYFFEITPDTWRYGLGYYSATRNTMDLFRQTLRGNSPQFLEVASCLGNAFTLEGDSYKRPLVKDQEPELANWYNRKSFAAICTRQDMEALFSGDLVAVLSQGFTQLEPLYHYLMNIETMKKAAQEAESDTREFSADKWFER